MIIRPAWQDDLSVIFEITEGSFAGLAAGHYSRAQVDRWMDGCSPESYREGVEAGRTRVAEFDGRVVGYVEAVPGEITRLFVLPQAAGRGIGKALAEVGLALARKNHTGVVRVESLLNAVPFYRKLGFVSLGQAVSSHGNDETPAIEIMIMLLHPA